MTPGCGVSAALTTVALCGFMTPLAGASVASPSGAHVGAAHAAQVSGPAASLASNDGQSKPVNLEGGDLSIFDAVATANGEVDLQLKDGATGTSHNPAQTTLKIPASTWQTFLTTIRAVRVVISSAKRPG